MYPAIHAARTPDKPAIIVGDTGDILTYAQLERQSTQLANALRAAGFVDGDVVALLSTNAVEVFVVYWACLRSGLYLTPVNTHLSPGEIAYIVNDCGARALVASADLAEAAAAARAECASLEIALSFDPRVGDGERGESIEGFGDYAEFVASGSPEAPDHQRRGNDMLYSSGTTGRPKGVKPPLPEREVGDPGDPYVMVFGGTYQMGQDTVYFSPAPLYHAAPLRFGMITQSLGGTVITVKKFDAQQCLELIERYRVTHTQWVPTHFVRMLRLPAEVRERYDVSSLTHAVHAAAPCPPEVKKAMMDWFGPILHEYYSSTEANGITMVNPVEWQTKPGTVGQAKLGVLHICSDEGVELPVGESGTVYFERDALPFSYHNDPKKTASAQHPEHPTWTTTGDIGYVDEDGYLFLNDRKAFTIISGGVNIYPQEIENCLALHPDVDDVAVVGVPDPEYGERVLAAVKTAPGVVGGDDVAQRLQTFVREHLAGYKVPREFRFVDDLPRTPTGKLVKGPLRQKFSTDQAGV
ncbi:acyl-CoA synthetase [Gordonia polyisoprenivorans]|uniref:acyl-CoA synthetase n=1 Tax=Gordonia polyisoprenivorans TaxID=84595 RepID=UPI000B99D74A|nr:acyl-CoA synthetase [Gordonia polyisoprenivorans]MBE7195669.1 acyl-CoA synthetase [Gordonia polyisoprenivorans]OZC29222.1 acyl-CoA synthetase [Gordonia polyisoprenivorans]